MKAILSSVGISAFVLAGAVAAGETVSPSAYAGGNERVQYSIAPNYSDDLGASIRAALGGYLNDRLALGVIAEYGRDKREYLSNAALGLSDGLSLAASIGMLEEHDDFGGAAKETAQQMEYGLSLKSARGLGMLKNYELNAYLADADVDTSALEAGRVYGVQLMTDIVKTDRSHFSIGGGYEWLDWDESADRSQFTFSVDASHGLTERLSLDTSAKLGASEQVFRGGLGWDLSDGGPNRNGLSLTYARIEGRDGIDDDSRVELGWSLAIGAGGKSAGGASGPKRMNLLADVMTRPSYLPERVIAKAQAVFTDCFEASATGYGSSADVLGASFPTEEAATLAVMNGVWSFYTGPGRNIPLPAPSRTERNLGLVSFFWDSGDPFNGGDPLRIKLVMDGKTCVGDTTSIYGGY